MHILKSAKVSVGDSLRVDKTLCGTHPLERVHFKNLEFLKRVQFSLFNKKGTLVKRVLKGGNQTPVSHITWQQTQF